MPKDNIERAIQKGAGNADAENYDTVLYEGYGPDGVAVMVECLTDNRNRTAAEVRSSFSKGGGNLAATGAVAFSFAHKGAIRVKPGPGEERVMEVALEGGAEDVLPLADDEGGGFEVRTDPQTFHAVMSALEQAGFALGESRLTYLPASTVKLEGETAQKMLKLLEMIEDSDDVQRVHANFELDEATLQSLA